MRWLDADLDVGLVEVGGPDAVRDTDHVVGFVPPAAVWSPIVCT